jgi:hypothetical protein
MSSTCGFKDFQAPPMYFCQECRSRGGECRMQLSFVSPLTILRVFGETGLGINSDSDRAASLVIGPTSLGMVRIYVESENVEIPMDFEPEEALDIANELRAAAETAIATAARAATAKAEADPAVRRDTNGGSKFDRKRGGGGKLG